LPPLRDVFPGIPLVESPLLYAMIDELDLTPEERRVALDLHERGFAVIDFDDDELHERIERIKAYLAPQFGIDLDDPASTKGASLRVQDAWSYSEDVRAIACNRGVLEMLTRLYGRKAFPFQTLNFPVGTQQPLHSDSIHFSSIPERFMCGVWLAMEDISADAGPLTYLPGSHRWPILSNAMIGRRGFEGERELAQAPFETAWNALVEHSGLHQEIFLAKKGQALIWAANLLHGGSPQTDPTRSRWSQVTHYYFDDCIYYTPSFSDEPLGLLDLRSVIDVQTEAAKPNQHLGERLQMENAHGPSAFARIRKRMRAPAGLPRDFDPEAYYRLNPDVAIAKVDAATHYVAHGKVEGRRYRYRSGG
jgi:ectoine hydroxylase-related dioxygenase (phytanoyl-CoA dioxygenase family)